MTCRFHNAKASGARRSSRMLRASWEPYLSFGAVLAEVWGRHATLLGTVYSGNGVALGHPVAPPASRSVLLLRAGPAEEGC